MSTLADIQAKVDDASVKISQGVFVGQHQKNSWREIRRTINEYPGLNGYGKMQLATLIHGRLDALGLQAGKNAVVINVQKLTEQVLEHLAEPDSQESIPPWFPGG